MERQGPEASCSACYKRMQVGRTGSVFPWHFRLLARGLQWKSPGATRLRAAMVTGGLCRTEPPVTVTQRGAALSRTAPRRWQLSPREGEAAKAAGGCRAASRAVSEGCRARP